MTSLSLDDGRDLKSFVSLSDHVTQGILVAKQLRNFIRSSSNIFFAVVLVVLIVPLSVVLYFLLRYFVWKIRKASLRDFTLQTNNYKSYRQKLEKLDKLSEKLQPFADARIDAIQWYARPFAKLTVDASRIVIEKRDLLSKKISELDTPISNPPIGWKTLSGNDLWDNRPSPYEYLI
jgi:hypothetical protein